MKVIYAPYDERCCHIVVLRWADSALCRDILYVVDTLDSTRERTTISDQPFCGSTATRLKLFDSQQIVLGSHDETTNHADTDHTNSNTGGLKNSTTTAAQADMMVASLADQLAEFRSFGASLQLSKDALVAGGGGTGAGSSGGVGSGSDQGSNATPPIALKT
mmetsp:Transcript_11885/g.16868  ORF Transcript_11885/g.16868 Transcript_11885/m.16868 type:complete len:162 (+) Transcript_11885:1663-2148(+)